MITHTTMTERLKQATANAWLDLAHKVVTIVILPWAVWVTNSIYESKRMDVMGASREDFRSLERIIDSKLSKLADDLVLFERQFSADFVRKDEWNAPKK